MGRHSLCTGAREICQNLVRWEPLPPTSEPRQSLATSTQSRGPRVSRLLVPLAWGSCPCTVSGHPWSFLEPRAALLLRCLEVNLCLQARWQGHEIRLLFAQKHSHLSDFLLSFRPHRVVIKKKNCCPLFGGSGLLVCL